MSAVENGVLGGHTGAATVTEFIGLFRVQLHRNPDRSIDFAHESKLFCDVVIMIIEDSGSQPVLGKFPMRRGSGQILAVFIYD